MLRSEKIKSVAKIADIYGKYGSVIVVHYHGASMFKLTELRNVMRADNVGGMQIVKNTLAKVAARSVGYGDSVCGLFAGPVAIAYSNDPVSVSRVMCQFSKSNPCMKIVGGFIDGDAITAETVARLSVMPSLQELHGKLIGVLKAPSSRVAAVISAPVTSIVRVIDAYSKK